jgi:hypothetical protein
MSLRRCRCPLNINLIDIQILYLILTAVLPLDFVMAVLATLRRHSSPLFGVRSAEEELINILKYSEDTAAVSSEYYCKPRHGIGP